MPWVKLDDNFLTNPKIMRAGLEGRALYIAGLCYCAAGLTDGILPAAVVKKVGALADVRRPATAAAHLVAVGLWEPVESGYRIHDYLKYQPSRVEVEAERRMLQTRRDLYNDPGLTKLVRDRDGSGCRYCGRTVNWADRKGALGGAYDHVIPDGPNTLENIVVACRGCNARKGQRTPTEAGMELLAPRSISAGNPYGINGSSTDKSQIPAATRPGPGPGPARPRLNPDTETTNPPTPLPRGRGRRSRNGVDPEQRMDFSKFSGNPEP